MSNIKSIIVSVVFITYVFASAKFTYQTHGFNDINALFQQIRKGNRKCKIDIAPATTDQCKKFSQKKDFALTEEIYDEEIGCLALRGDWSSVPYYDNFFSTTEDLIELILSERLQKIMKALPESEFISFEFDIQSLGTTTEKSVLVIDFVLKIIDLLPKNPKVKISLNRCYPLIFKEYCSRFPTRCSSSKEALDKIIASKDFYCENSNYQPPEKRLFNMETRYLNFVCKTTLPSYQNSTLPYFFWEMNNRKTMVDFLTRARTNCPSVEAHDMVLTTNIDIDLFRKLYYYAFPNEANGKIYKYSDIGINFDHNLVHQSFAKTSDLGCSIINSRENGIFVNIFSIAPEDFGTVLDTVQLREGIPVGTFIAGNLIEQPDRDPLLIFFTDEQMFAMPIDGKTISEYWGVDYKNFHDGKSGMYGYDFDPSERCISTIILSYVDEFSFQYLNIKLCPEDFKVIDSFTVKYNVNVKIARLSNLKVDLEAGILLFTAEADSVDDSKAVFVNMLDIKNKKLGEWKVFLGSADDITFDVKNNRFALVLNSCPHYYGHGSINNNEANMCSSFLDPEKCQTRINRKHLTQYYYGKLDFFNQQNEFEKYVSPCNPDILHGTVGYSIKAVVNFFEHNQVRKLIVTEQLASMSDVESLAVIFGGLYDSTPKEQNMLAMFEIPINEFLFE